jgi:uracil-DNA glycosylase family 4
LVKTVGLGYVGNTSPHALFIYSHPTYTEDQSGRAFRSKDGLVLKKIAHLKLPTSGLSFTFAVRCWPSSEGRTVKPTTITVKACNPHLTKEIECLNPLVLVPVGSLACRALGVKGAMERIAGIPSQATVGGREYKCVPMLDPAHIRMKPALRTVWESHWNALAHVITEGDNTDFLLKVKGRFATANEVAQLLYEYPGPVALDLETTGLKPEQGSILTVAVAIPDEALGAALRTPEDLLAFCLALQTRSPERPLVVHGSRFEEPWFRRLLGVELEPGTLIDTLLLANRAYPGLPANLAALTARVLPELSGFKSETEALLSDGHALRVEPRDLLLRNIVDAAVLLPIADHLLEVWTAKLAVAFPQEKLDTPCSLGGWRRKRAQG